MPNDAGQYSAVHIGGHYEHMNARHGMSLRAYARNVFQHLPFPLAQSICISVLRTHSLYFLISRQLSHRRMYTDLFYLFLSYKVEQNPSYSQGCESEYASPGCQDTIHDGRTCSQYTESYVPQDNICMLSTEYAWLVQPCHVSTVNRNGCSMSCTVMCRSEGHRMELRMHCHNTRVRA